jgi:hypothetical protein
VDVPPVKGTLLSDQMVMFLRASYFTVIQLSAWGMFCPASILELALRFR